MTEKTSTLNPAFVALLIIGAYIVTLCFVALNNPSIIVGVCISVAATLVTPFRKSSRFAIPVISILKRFSVAIILLLAGIAGLVFGNIDQLSWLYIAMGLGIGIIIRTEVII